MAERRGESSQASWMTPFGTLMTILMVFFLILYAYNQFIRRSMMAADMDMQLEAFEEKLGEKAMIQIDKDEINLQLADEVLFDLGDATLKREAKEALHEVANVLKKSESHIVVKGHTDNLPIVEGRKFRSNWHLSCARAFSVIRYLTSSEGIPADRLSAWGYAEYEPVAPFDTREERARNRRIEISLVQETVLE